MKIIDLLNKGFNNELIPKTIVYGNDLFYWNENLQDYTTSLDPNVIDSNTYFMQQLDFGRLNDEIEIIEEPKKIEKIEMVGCNVRVPGLNNELFGTDTPLALEITIFKVNELIDEVNKLI